MSPLSKKTSTATHPAPAATLEVLASGLVFRNPAPHLRAVHTWHPSIACREDGELVASFDLGEGAESLNYRTHVAHSSDGGATWSPPQPLLAASWPTAPRRSTHTIRISRPGGGAELVGLGIFFFRDNPEVGMINHENLGMVEAQPFLVRSSDGGRTWSQPSLITPPLVGPGFEICHPVVGLADGRWLAPTSTWRGWDGSAPNGMRAVAWVSHDRGRTWPSFIEVMDHRQRGVITWEQSLVQLADGRLVSIAWLFNEGAGRSDATEFAVSLDGKYFAAPQTNGLRAQTAKLLRLPDDRLLCLYRRDDKPGLWAHLAQVDEQRWIGLADSMLWSGAASGMSGQGKASDELSGLKFGYPTMTMLPDGHVLALIWCMEDNIQNIRWFKLKVG